MAGHKKGSLLWYLENVVRMHESVYGWDKTVKVSAYALSLASGYAQRVKGAQHPITAGLAEAGGHMGMHRVCERLAGGPFGLPAEIDNLLNGRWSGGWEDPAILRCNQLQSLSMCVYYPLEHLLWASAAVPSLCKLPPWASEAASRVSCMFWSLWLLVDLYAVRRRYAELAKVKALLLRRRAMTPQLQAAIDRKAVDLRFHLARLLFYLPNALHWSLPSHYSYLGTGLPPRLLLQLFGLAEAVTGWIATFQGRGPSRPAGLPSIKDSE
mmetsp:Transcript_43836/g.109789  ORF Transcript_43836/g.109789 Transcript_43836/m.109789 type:complete len:268 (+) Transcript_43836:36-839(+)